MKNKQKAEEICKRIMESDFYLIVGLTGHTDRKLNTAFCQTFSTADIPPIITKIQEGELRRGLDKLLERLNPKNSATAKTNSG